jgi:hypothetical protein
LKEAATSHEPRVGTAKVHVGATSRRDQRSLPRREEAASRELRVGTTKVDVGARLQRAMTGIAAEPLPQSRPEVAPTKRRGREPRVGTDKVDVLFRSQPQH